eukprot:scaffold1201_cov199-Alexandrium_tamarense.AAC.7
MACSGVHREFNHKIKGIGHSSFTPEEIAKLRHPDSGNEAVNARYLANYNAQRERMRPPQNNNDLQLLRGWIQRKYIDKAWCDSKGDPGGGGGKLPTSSSSKAKSTPKTDSGRRKIMPPVASQPAAPTEDLFGFDSVASAPAATSAGSSWDAFGSTPTQQSQPTPAALVFQADFGNMDSTAASPAAAPHAAPSFQADFGNFDQPTVVAMPPVEQAVVGQQLNQHQQPPFQANFDHQSAALNQINQQPQSSVSQPNQVQQPFTPNFNAMDQPSQHHFNQNQVQMQVNSQMQSGDAQGGMGFSQFPQQQQIQQQPEQNRFGNFSSMETQQAPHEQSNKMIGRVPNQQGTVAFGQFPQQQINAQQEQSEADNVSTIQPIDMQQQNNQTQGMGANTQRPAPANQPDFSEEQSDQVTSMNPNAFRSVESDKKSAFDAFDNLSLEPTPLESSAASSSSGTSSAAKAASALPQFQEGQQVVFTNSTGSSGATIMKAHYDDELKPYHAINVNGRGKQTDDAHLSLPNESNTSNNSSSFTLSNTNSTASSTLDFGKSAKLQETVAMLQNLNVQELMQVQQFIANMGATNVQSASNESTPQLLNETGLSNKAPTQINMASVASMPYQYQQGMANGGMGVQMNLDSQMNNAYQPSSFQCPVNGLQNQASTSVQQGPAICLPNHTMMQQQPMGMHQNPAMSMQHQPNAPPPPPPQVPTSPALPPVEKEGNPFDMY